MWPTKSRLGFTKSLSMAKSSGMHVGSLYSFLAASFFMDVRDILNSKLSTVSVSDTAVQRPHA